MSFNEHETLKKDENFDVEIQRSCITNANGLNQDAKPCLLKEDIDTSRCVSNGISWIFSKSAKHIITNDSVLIAVKVPIIKFNKYEL